MGVARPLRGAAQRALLATLLIRANEVVSEDACSRSCGATTQPGSGGAALRMRVSQLRKARSAARRGDGDARPGYALEAAEAGRRGRFERLLGEGRRRCAGEPARGPARCARRSALWRGPALADLAYEPFAQAEIARLEELRLDALEERIDAELAPRPRRRAGGRARGAGRRAAAARALRGQLMLALYRSGRQAEALAAYRERAGALVAELGIEPGAALQELERAILRQDPALAAGRPRRRRPRPRVRSSSWPPCWSRARASTASRRPERRGRGPQSRGSRRAGS